MMAAKLCRQCRMTFLNAILKRVIIGSGYSR
jgi:hypothetical protein